MGDVGLLPDVCLDMGDGRWVIWDWPRIKKMKGG